MSRLLWKLIDNNYIWCNIRSGKYTMVGYMRYDEVEKQVIDIIFPIRFSGDDICKKLGYAIPLSSAYKTIIRHEVMEQFGVELKCDLANLSTSELCKIIYAEMQKSEKRPNKWAFEKQTWNRREICSYIQRELSDFLGRNVFSDECISKLRTELGKSREKDFDDKLAVTLWDAFDEIMDADFLSDKKCAIYNIANRITYNLVAKGRAVSPEQECEGMDDFWRALWISMAFNNLSSILRQNFNIQDTIRTLPKNLLKIKSYEEYEEKVIRLVIKTKIDNIIIKSNALPKKFVDGQDLSLEVIPAASAEQIKQGIQNLFHVKVKYDLSDSVVNGLYSYVYHGVKNSYGIQSRLLGGTRLGNASVVSEINDDAPKSQNQTKTREVIFSKIIGVIGRKVGRHGIRRGEKLCDLYEEMSKKDKSPDDLKDAIESFVEKEYKVTLKIGNPDVTIWTICDTVHKQVANKGESEYVKVAFEDMDVLWGALNKATPSFRFLKSVVENIFHVRVSVYRLSNCHTFYEYKQLITTALQQKAMNQVKS